jgi:pimaricinolide synthase PimS1
VTEQALAEATPGNSEFLIRFRAVPAAAQREELVQLLELEIGKVLGESVEGMAEQEQRFFEMGLDSLMAVEFQRKLSTKLSLTLSATLLFECPTIGSLADYLLLRLSPEPDADWDSDLVKELESELNAAQASEPVSGGVQ